MLSHVVAIMCTKFGVNRVTNKADIEFFPFSAQSGTQYPVGYPVGYPVEYSAEY